METYITFGIGYIGDTPDVFCRIIATKDETTAIRIAEDLGNATSTTIAYTAEGLIALACERADYIDSEDSEDIL